MATASGSTISLFIDNEMVPDDYSGIPWYPGITVLQAMIIAQAMYPKFLNFKINYHSEYGAFVEQIHGDAEGDGRFWLLSINNIDAMDGPSEAIVIENPTGSIAEVRWSLRVPKPDIASARMRAGIVATRKA